MDEWMNEWMDGWMDGCMNEPHPPSLLENGFEFGFTRVINMPSVCWYT